MPGPTVSGTPAGIVVMGRRGTSRVGFSSVTHFAGNPDPWAAIGSGIHGTPLRSSSDSLAPAASKGN